MTPLPVSDVTLQELGQLPPRALAAFAARVAGRALGLIANRGPAADFAALATAARAAAAVAAGDPFPDPAVVPRAYEAAESLHEVAGFAGFAAAHAARAALFAAGGGDAEDADAALTETVASSYGATRAVLTACSQDTEMAVRAAFRADFDRLAALTAAVVDVSDRGPLGPLWPPGQPG